MKAMKTAMVAAALVSLLFLATALCLASTAEGEHLTVRALDTMGSQVRVLVSNTGANAHTGTVQVQVKTDGGTATAAKPIRVPAQGEATALFTFASTVTEIVYVGIIEDPDPIP